MSNRCLNSTVTEKLFFKNLPGTRGPLHSGAPWTLPTLPTPLLRRWAWSTLVPTIKAQRITGPGTGKSAPTQRIHGTTCRPIAVKPSSVNTERVRTFFEQAC